MLQSPEERVDICFKEAKLLIIHVHDDMPYRTKYMKSHSEDIFCVYYIFNLVYDVNSGTDFLCFVHRTPVSVLSLLLCQCCSFRNMCVETMITALPVQQRHFLRGRRSLSAFIKAWPYIFLAHLCLAHYLFAGVRRISQTLTLYHSWQPINTGLLIQI